ncbi:MAG TPA: choice-of-anchor D domain-containing protein, partial [Candidatus Binataceae bacterium]|nr:choice-of-anchor D domain-containing protein [Candidatus Binataceae bacterium]
PLPMVPLTACGTPSRQPIPVVKIVSSSYKPAGAAILDDGGNIFNQDPLLDPNGLQFNGGPTEAVALLEGSPADGTGNNPVCQQVFPVGLDSVDQRGVPRFRPGDERCDMGAFQFVTLLVQPFQPPSLTFGAEPIGHQSPPQAVTIDNNQTRSVTVRTRIGGTNATDFRILANSCGSSVSGNGVCGATIVFRPHAAGVRSAVLTVSDIPDPTRPYKLTLTGVGK